MWPQNKVPGLNPGGIEDIFVGILHVLPKSVSVLSPVSSNSPQTRMYRWIRDSKLPIGVKVNDLMQTSSTLVSTKQVR